MLVFELWEQTDTGILIFFRSLKYVEFTWDQIRFGFATLLSRLDLVAKSKHTSGLFDSWILRSDP